MFPRLSSIALQQKRADSFIPCNINQFLHGGGLSCYGEKEGKREKREEASKWKDWFQGRITTARCIFLHAGLLLAPAVTLELVPLQKLITP